MGWVGGAECFPSYGPLGSNLEAFGLPGFLAGAVTPVPVWLVSCFTGVVCIYWFDPRAATLPRWLSGWGVSCVQSRHYTSCSVSAFGGLDIQT